MVVLHQRLRCVLYYTEQKLIKKSRVPTGKSRSDTLGTRPRSLLTYIQPEPGRPPKCWTPLKNNLYPETCYRDTIYLGRMKKKQTQMPIFLPRVRVLHQWDAAECQLLPKGLSPASSQPPPCRPRCLCNHMVRNQGSDLANPSHPFFP